MDKGEKAFIIDVAHRLDRLEEVAACLCDLAYKTNKHIEETANNSVFEWLGCKSEEIYEEKAAAEGDRDE